MRLWLPCVLLLVACPERKPPPVRAVTLRFAFADAGMPYDARALVERRLAHAQLKARVVVDEQSVRVDVPPDGDVDLTQAVLLAPGLLEVCASAAEPTRRLCGVANDAGVDVVPSGDGCNAVGTEPLLRGFLQRVAPDAGVRLGKEGSGRVRGYYATEPCVRLRVTDVFVDADAQPPQLRLTLDEASRSGLGDFTSQHVSEQVLLVLDGYVVSAPVVLEPIRGKALVLVLPHETKRGARAVAAALAGGAWPADQLLSVVPR